MRQAAQLQIDFEPARDLYASRTTLGRSFACVQSMPIVDMVMAVAKPALPGADAGASSGTVAGLNDTAWLTHRAEQRSIMLKVLCITSAMCRAAVAECIWSAVLP